MSDRFEEKAKDLFELVTFNPTHPASDRISYIAQALREERDAALEDAAHLCHESGMNSGEQLATLIRALKSGAKP